MTTRIKFCDGTGLDSYPILYVHIFFVVRVCTESAYTQVYVALTNSSNPFSSTYITRTHVYILNDMSPVFFLDGDSLFGNILTCMSF